MSRIHEQGTQPPVNSEWYFGVLCDGCHQPILFARDPSQGAMKFAGAGPTELRCPAPGCSHQMHYHTVNMWHFQVFQYKTRETR